MTVTYGFYDSLSGDRKYNAKQMSQLFKGIITDGVLSSVGSGLVVSVNSGMTLNVAAGRAWFNQTWTDNDANITVTILASEAVLNRIDSVVVEVNTDIAVRANSIKVIKGTPATTPVAPTMANTATLHQYPLANVYVGGAVTSINAGNITNMIGTASCPFATGAVPSFDYTPLLSGWQSTFNNWFANLVDQLSGVQVTNLQNQIDNLVAGWVPATGTWTYASATTINIPAGGAGLYTVGDKIRMTNSGTKYNYIITVADTLLTVVGDGVANAAITVPYYSKAASPIGFPTSFAYPAVWSANAGTLPTIGNGAITSRFKFVGGIVIYSIYVTFGTTTNFGSGANWWTLSVPIANPNPISGMGIFNHPATAYGYGAAIHGGAAGPTGLALASPTGGGFVNATYPFVWASGDSIQISGTYMA